MAEDTTRLGPFILGECIGSGGMGKIYRATHQITGVEVAVKVIRGGATAESEDLFQREVQAQAALAHPGIVYLFDYGIVSRPVNAASGTAFITNSPYVVMEFADGGTVRDAMPTMDWASLRDLLVQVFEALAFAHARGVIHRDLKPENFLSFSTPRGPRIKLADFGIAHAFATESLRDEESLSAVTGTPLYMAPEQLRGEWRHYGPWTDLYAVGCIAYEIVCGRPPFYAASASAIAIKHCTAPRPALVPRIEVPRGLEAWIQKAMALDRAGRFRHAADALRALPHHLEEGATLAVQVQELEESDAAYAETAPLGTTSESTHVWVDSMGQTIVNAPVPEDTLPWTPSLPPSLAEAVVTVPDWRVVESDGLAAPLIGTGLGLFGLRTVPFIDRDQARDLLWSALKDVIGGDRVRVVFIEGMSGTGKSRLAQWLTNRVNELGLASVFEAFHGAGVQGPTEGLPGLVQRAFKTWRMPRGRFYAHLSAHLPEADARALTELVHPTREEDDEVDGPRYRFTSPVQKQAVILRTLSGFEPDRRGLLWLDDLQWGPDGLGLLEYILANAPSMPPMLVVATLRADVVSEHAELRTRLEALYDHDCLDRIALGPLGRDDYRALIDRILPLEPALGDDLARRTEGNPLFAHHLLSEWVGRNLLKVGPTGFRVDTEKAFAIPDDIHDLWTSRLDHLVEGYPNDQPRDIIEPIELAATLGREVDGEEWKDACSLAGLHPPPGLVDELVARGLAERREEGWGFSHGLFVESLHRMAREARRLEDHHRVSASMLESGSAERRRLSARRRAEHWLAAGEPERALRPLEEESIRLRLLGENGRRLECLRQRKEIFDQLRREVHDVDRLQNELHISGALRSMGRTDEAIACAEAALVHCSDPSLITAAHSMLGECIRVGGKIPEAIEHLEKALACVQSIDSPAQEGRAHLILGWIYFNKGDAEATELHFQRAHDLLGRAGSIYDQLMCDAHIGWLEVNRCAHDAARLRFSRVIKVAEEYGFRPIESYCLAAMGDMARYDGDYEEARRFGRRCWELEIERGSIKGEAAVIMNLAQIETKTKNFVEAERFLAIAWQRATSDPPESLRGLLDTNEIALAAGLGHWTRVDEYLSSYADGWPRDFHVLKDHAWLLELAAEFAREAAKPEPEQRMLALALELWQKLDDAEAEARVAERLRELK